MAKKFACAAAFCALIIAQTIAGNAQQPASSESVMAPPLKIGSGDLVEVTMFENPDLSGNFRVDERGDITVPLIGSLHVEGVTAGEAAQMIERRYVEAEILQPAESHATVFIAEYATQGITVVGEVKASGVYPALGVRMLNDVITAAGGVTLTAASKVIITHKNDPENQITVDYIPEALKPVIPNVQIFPGDTVNVPRAGIVYVVGNVNRPGGYVLDGRNMLTVEEAMALAGNSGRAAAIKRAQLVRSLEDGRKEAITIPINLIYKGQAPDVALKDGDILYVPTSTGKLVGEQALTSILQLGTQVGIYRTTTSAP
ncbi:MAG: polysaccharide biosynthesis/export family protein [Terracidiphilus sp.]|jgi:polysaccharide export outer membrane protein